MKKLKLIILCLIAFAFVLHTPAVSSFQKARKEIEREPATKTMGRSMPEITAAERTSARRSSPFTASVREVQAEFKRLDIESRAPGSTIEVDAVGNAERSGQIRVKISSQSENRVVERTSEQEFLIDLSLVYVSDAFINHVITAIFSRSTTNKPIDGVKVKQIGAGADYEVVEDYSYQYGANKITVPKGFRYDRASVPRIFWAIVDKDSLSNVAPLFHDFLYRNGGRLENRLVSPYRTFTREETDRLFLELMTSCGVDYLRRRAAFEAVRNFSGSAWQG